MEYLVGTSPEQLLAAYRDLFPLPIRPGFELCQAWGNFVAWIYAIRHEGMSAELTQLGRRLHYQLRVSHAAKENPGANFQTLAIAIGDPRREEDPVFQAAQKAKKNILLLLQALRVVFDTAAQGITAQHAMCN
ncbi:hypothetical protein DQ04_02061110 [Trypanosoma grayi]|uniref:hypothetical protein n=1 Tax=Trypanosoma grayi TaxID=71804 RepID=UPI0004F43908|nr:hypothetical protein DQ04_02061110 [Trypanosoma grayi]KEG12034.1 hypothetical protein DQ04_02061110 [Trypanosoma grayi]